MLKFTFRSAIIFLFAISLFSCGKSMDPNKEFNDKYSLQVKSMVGKMPSEHVAPVDYKTKSSFGSITQLDVINDSLNKEKQYYPYFDVRKFGKNNPRNYLPNREVYDRSHFQNPSNQMPPDIFEVTYENRQYPPFKYQGARFDAIAVPSKDIYGVATKMTNKEYLLAGNNKVQNAIDNLEKNRNSFDDENSKILIGEQKRLRYERKIAKIFGEEAQNTQRVEPLANIENNAEDVTMKDKEKEKDDDKNS